MCAPDRCRGDAAPRPCQATLATLARSVGYVVKVEPRFAPQLHATATDPHTGEPLPATVNSTLERGDLLLIRHNHRCVVDVTVCRPTGQTEMRLRGDTPLASAAQKEKGKHTKYDAQCEREGARMVPFALESYGARGKQATRLLLQLADASEELSAAAFIRHASAALSVALQCGNADVAAKGVQAMRVQQAAAQAGGLGHSGSTQLPGLKQLQQRAARMREEMVQVPVAYHSLLHAAAAVAPVRGSSLSQTAATSVRDWLHPQRAHMLGLAPAA